MRLLFLSGLLLLASCSNSPTPTKNANGNATTAKATVPVYSFEIVRSFPHDPTAFTQGLVYHNGLIYEGTGGKGSDPYTSSLRKVELESGKILKKHELGPEYFGEGITIHDDKIYQLTWRERTAFVYNLEDFSLLKEFRYSGEGWGLTDDGTMLYMSDGTHVIRVVDPETFETKRTIVVNDEKGQPLMQLNELEWVKGEIWTNIWQTGWIVRIDPATGKLLGRIDMNALVQQEQKANPKADVLNGIAYDEATDRTFVTGKLWTRLFEIKVNPKQ